jgi:hypothetical protein
MPLDVLEADFVHNGVDSAALRRDNAQALKLDLIVRILQRDDPLRRSYLRRRWQGHSIPVSLSQDGQGCNLAATSLSLIALRRR